MGLSKRKTSGNIIGGSTLVVPGQPILSAKKFEVTFSNKRGEIDHQGVDRDDILSFLSWAGIEVAKDVPLKTALSLNEGKEKLWNKLNEVPIDIVSLPDETFWLRDGHHRAKLADLAGFEKIPAIVT